MFSKTAKRVLGALLGIVMALMVVTPALADEPETGTITISDAVPGQTYSVYRILDLESYSGTNFSYKPNEAWEDFVEAQVDFFEINENGYVSWVGPTESARVAAFAQTALAYANQHDIGPSVASQQAPNAAEGQKYSTVEFSNLPLGWYLVDSSLGAFCSIDTTNPDVTIEEKNEEPEIKKEDVTPGANDPSVGDKVDYKVTVTVQPGAQNYVVHDSMASGLTPVDADNDGLIDVTVSVGNSVVDESNFSVTAGDETTDPCTFHLTFDDTYVASLSAGTEIIITYSATINANAVTGTDPVTNEAVLEYGDENRTEPSIVTTNLYAFDLVKTDSSSKLLDGATFQLFEDSEGGTALYVVKTDSGYRIATSSEQGATQDIVVSGGKVTIDGLGNGSYYLQETVAPDGYNRLAGRTSVVVEDSDNLASVSDGTYVSGGVVVVNKTGSELPSTGGMGTTVLYIVGGALVVGAGITLVVRRRMSAEA